MRTFAFPNETMNIDETSKLLGLPQTTVKRWIRQGKIPVQEIEDSYIFSKREIEKWARKHNIFLQTDGRTPKSRPPRHKDLLTDAMNRGGVFHKVKGKTVSEVIKKTVYLAPLSPEVDKAFLVDLMLQREKLASTGVGHGVALPHPRYPLERMFSDTVIVTSFLENPVDFKAVDGEPVFVLFMLLSPKTQMHLHYLSRLSFCLRNREFIAFLQKCDQSEALLRQVERLETSLNER
jgi:PTS system nitrogen regulatory IIA component